jgi:hypothetical protein
MNGHAPGILAAFKRAAGVELAFTSAMSARGNAEQPAEFTAADLQGMEFKDHQFVVENLIAEVLNLLVSRPKLGKSWMALEFAVAVAMGRLALGSARVAPGDVLYLVLEDRPRRLQNRLRKLLGSADFPKRLTFWTESNRLDNGCLDRIGEWIE